MSAPTDSILHKGVHCDECDMTPIVGKRYSCVVCTNYDLCETCMESGKHPVDHPLLLLRTPHAYEEYMAYTSKQTSILSAHLDYIAVLREQEADEMADRACQEFFAYLTQDGLMHLRTHPALRDAALEKCRETLRSKKASLGLRTWAIALLNMFQINTREISEDGETAQE